MWSITTHVKSDTKCAIQPKPSVVSHAAVPDITLSGREQTAEARERLCFSLVVSAVRLHQPGRMTNWVPVEITLVKKKPVDAFSWTLVRDSHLRLVRTVTEAHFLNKKQHLSQGLIQGGVGYPEIWLASPGDLCADQLSDEYFSMCVVFFCM